jgi:hypothetical protein
VSLYPNAQHILVSNTQVVDIYTFNGVTWSKTLDNEIIDGSNGIEVHPGTNFYAFRLGIKYRLMVKTWNGTSWTTTFPSTNLSMNGHDFEVKGFNEHILLRHNADDWLQILSWTGSTWDSTFTRTQMTTDGSAFDFDEIGPDYVPLRYAADAQSNEMEILQWNAATKIWDRPFRKQQVGMLNYNIDFFPCPDYIAIKVNTNMLQVFRNNGTSWTQAMFTTPFQSQSIEISSAGPAFGILGGTNELKCYYKYQDHFDNNLRAFTVTQKKITDPYASGGTALTTTYDYNIATDANFDTRAGCAKFNKVDISTAGSGKTTQYFFNDIETQATINPSYDELDGMVYKTETSNERGVIIDSAKSATEIFRRSYWPATVKQKRVTTSSAWNNGIESRNDLLSYNKWNGLPQITRTFNSDGTQRLTKTIFAFESFLPSYNLYMDGSFKYQEFERFNVGAYMLTAPFQTVVYEKAAGATTIQPASSEIRSA